MENKQTQGAHGSRTEEMIYGVLMSENPFSTQSEQKQFLKLSQQWHLFLQFPSARRDMGCRITYSSWG